MAEMRDPARIFKNPLAVGRLGIHLSPQLEIDADALRRGRIAWAAETMERAAKRIRELEDIVLNLDRVIQSMDDDLAGPASIFTPDPQTEDDE